MSIHTHTCAFAKPHPHPRPHSSPPCNTRYERPLPQDHSFLLEHAFTLREQDPTSAGATAAAGFVDFVAQPHQLPSGPTSSSSSFSGGGDLSSAAKGDGAATEGDSTSSQATNGRARGSASAQLRARARAAGVRGFEDFDQAQLSPMMRHYVDTKKVGPFFGLCVALDRTTCVVRTPCLWSDVSACVHVKCPLPAILNLLHFSKHAGSHMSRGETYWLCCICLNLTLPDLTAG